MRQLGKPITAAVNGWAMGAGFWYQLGAGITVASDQAALVHSSHNETREELVETQRTQGLRAYLGMRDGPFQPEPMGLKSAKGRAARAARDKT